METILETFHLFKVTNNLKKHITESSVHTIKNAKLSVQDTK